MKNNSNHSNQRVLREELLYFILEKAFKKYSLDVYDYFSQRDDVESIIVMGYSIGTGVSNYVASQRQVSGLVLMAPYADGYDLCNNYLDIFHGPTKALVSFKMKAVKFATKVSVKPLILATKADKVVPYESSARLFDKYKNGCNFVTIDDIGHNDFWDTQEVITEITKYIKDIKGKGEV